MPNNKYNARHDGGFDSQFERSVYHALMELQLNPKRQILIQLTSSISWRCDFQTCYGQYIEAKGIITEAFTLKLRLIHDLQPIDPDCLLLVVGNNKALKRLRRIHRHCCLLQELPSYVLVRQEDPS